MIITNERLAQGRIIREPVGRGSGYWVGCPGAYYDALENVWYLTYRIRRPRGVVPDRGGEVRIARSTDLVQWDDVLTITKDRYDSASIERSCLHRGVDGLWRYFTSYVHPDDGRWCTAVIKAPTVGELDPAKREVILTGPPLGLEGVKDPWIIEVDGVYHLYLSIATPTPATGGDSHETLDIFNTGECKSATGLATSRDLDHWDWQGSSSRPGRRGGTAIAGDSIRSCRWQTAVPARGISRFSTAAPAIWKTTRKSARWPYPATCDTGNRVCPLGRRSPAPTHRRRSGISMPSLRRVSGISSMNSPGRMGRTTCA